MTSGWCDGRLGGPVVVLDQVQSTAAWVGSPIKPLSTHGVLDAGRSRGARSPCIRRPGKVAIQADAGGQGPHASRDAARDAPEPRYHKPKTPIGRRGASLICLRTDRCGDQTSPAPLTPSSTRGGNAGGRFVTKIASSIRLSGRPAHDSPQSCRPLALADMEPFAHVRNIPISTSNRVIPAGGP